MRVYPVTYPFADILPPDARNAVVAIGNFDALHRGHHALLEIARRRALDLGRPFAVLTFEPHPRRLFRPDDPPFRITPWPVKRRRLEAAQVDIVYSLEFSWDIAHLSAQDFMQRVLYEHLGAAHLVVGADFHFGAGRSGTISALQEKGFPCTIVDQIKDAQNGIYSATRVRGLIQAGHIDEANALLGWEWEIEGVVETGDQRGRELGYPTANIALGDTIHPAYGIYAALVQIEGDIEWRMAAVNIGVRPMFTAPVALVEAFLLDYQGNLYGKILRLRPVQKIRDEACFDDLDALKEQMGRDCAACRVLLQPLLRQA